MRLNVHTIAGLLGLGGAAVLVILGITGLPSGPRWEGGEPGAGAVVPPEKRPPTTDSTVFLERRLDISVPSALRRSDWRIHPTVLSAREVAPIGKGWLVLDHRSSRLHFLDADLELVRSLGREGDGPGELRRPSQLAVLGDTLAAVLDGMGVRLDLFSSEGRFVDRAAVRVPGCTAGPSRELLADPAGGFVVQGLCGATTPRWTAAKVTLEGRASVIVAESLGADGEVLLPLGRAVVAWRGALWLGGTDGCFRRIEPQHGSRPPTHFCLPSEPRVRVPDSLRSAVAHRSGSTPVAVPEFWPPFVTAGWSAAGPVLGLPDEDPDGVRALLRDDGTLAVLRTKDRASPGSTGLLLVRTFLDGTGFRFVPWSDVVEEPAR